MRVHTADNFYLPIWSASLFSILFTSLLWYHPIIEKLRGVDQKGFEVAVVEGKNERQDAEDAKV